MEVHPLQSFPSSETGRGLRRRKADEAATAAMTMKVKRESNQTENDELSAPVSPSINLGLQIGTNSAGSRNERTSIVHRSRESLITVGQLQELEQQVLIHKYLAAGLRVPTHLLVPIWKSVARTLGPNVNVIGFNPVGFDYGSMMEPEPWRCRRTDGKKWRCSRKTVPHQKYCERHMHRGRQRSRKPVEASENDSTSKKILLNNSDRDIRCTLDVTTAIPFPHVGAVVPEPKTVSYASPKSATETITSSMRGASAIGMSCADGTKTIRMIPSSALNTTATCITTVPNINPTATTSIPTSYIVNLKDACNMNFRENCSKSRNDFGRNDINIQKITSPGLGFSPNSVLQVSGCSSSLCDSKINLEREPGRCRRTDGKKWRCRRDIIPNQKYCSLHMHRGSKKHLKPSQNAPVLAPSAATYGSSLLPTPLKKLEPATPNTNLSMSIQADDKQRHNEARNNASSSSETTITDTTITA